MRSVRWTAEALAKLDGILSYIGEHEQRPELAKTVIARIIDRTAQLAVAPESGRILADHDDPSLRELLVRPYRIIYQVEDNTCTVLTVMHYRQLIPNKRFLKSVRGDTG